MGRGKSSAAIRHMNEHRGEKRFVYITPYLDEVDRVCERCDFAQPEPNKEERTTKSAELKRHLKAGHNVSTTHALFSLMDDEALELVRQKHYVLIADESLDTISRRSVTEYDREIMLNGLVAEGEHGKLTWVDEQYEGKFSGYKNDIGSGSIFQLDTAWFRILDPELLRAFSEVFMLTYMFNGQYQRAYLDYFGFQYRIVGVEQDKEGFRFSDRPDEPPPIDYSKLIHIVDTKRMNAAWDDKHALSNNWFKNRSYNHPEVKKLRSCMRSYFRDDPGGKDARLWTCYKEWKEYLVDARTGRFRNNFLQISARATNAYRDRTRLAYMANRFLDTNIKKLFEKRDIKIDPDEFALSEMLQWIWRSAIRDDKPIDLYIPSRRMRDLLIDWIEQNKNGGKRV